ncbi:phage portal protein family protein [Corynebacterium pygosceleis]|uniref:Portal protein n=1 Tax=Corynebacterium pygosceleis TaxID=2800406 RepID=A0ABT3WUC6_9CORY|nr:hypothetical protein [Corynebacterium pygosceleis]MCK7676376.1 hypothetical protein [Corynebacterium pygosceleis]MCX7445829.1 hypothetical protein [Corynebacterium pygosceleis]
MVETREIGHAVPAGYGPLVEDNWELRWPQSIGVYAKMSREDSQVTSVLKAISLPIRRATWRVDPNGAPDEIVARVAEDLRLPVLGDDSDSPKAPVAGRVSWKVHLQQALRSLVFGHMFFEQVYSVDDDGQVHLRKLAARSPDTIEAIEVAEDGGLAGIKQKPPHTTDLRKQASLKPIFIPVEKLVAYVHDPADSTWQGTSVLRPVFKHWRLRDELLRLECTVLDRNGMGVPVYSSSDASLVPGANPQQEIDTGQAIVESLRSGESAGAALPFGAKLEIQGTKGQLVSPRPAIDYHDSMIAKAVLAHFLNLSDGGGSYALAETQADLFIQSLQTIAEWIADTATQHIVEDLVHEAFPPYVGPTPQIMFDPIASKRELTAAALAQLVQAGVFFMDPKTEDEIRRRYGMPTKEPRDEDTGKGAASAVPDTE